MLEGDLTLNQFQGENLNPLSKINDDDLANYVMELFRNDISDKEDGGWTSKRVYDINAYEGNKVPVTFPWVNACNFPVPLTPTLVDTAHSNIMASIFSDREGTVDVQGVGVEDIRKAPILSQLLNWQINTDTNAYEVMDKVVFKSLLNGCGIVKVIQSYFENKVLLESVPAENIYLPVNAMGFKVNETDHVIEVVPLTFNDIQERRRLKNRDGSPIYDGIEDIPSGLRVAQSTSLQATTRAKDDISGIRVDQRNTRDMYYIIEVYLTYYPLAKRGEISDSIELIVTLAPSNKKILRKVLNKEKIRPYVAFIPYPRDDRFWGISLPEKIRFIQEELDYSHNQNINAADRAINPPGFYNPTSGFDPEVHQIAPSGMYPATEPPTFSTISVNPIFERQEERYWDLAERLTGLTELFQGRAPSRTKTLGEARLRNNRSEIRFRTVYQRYEKGWSDMIRLIYFYDNIYMPKDKKIKILGFNDFKTVEELFPEGLEGQYNFTFRSATLTEIEQKKQDTIRMTEAYMNLPIVQNDRGSMWKVMKRHSESLGERNLETLVNKPEEANILSAEESIQRLISGQTDIVPEPGIDAPNYMLRLQLFMLTDSFKNSKQEVQAGFIKLLERVKNIAIGQFKAKRDAILIKQGNRDNFKESIQKSNLSVI